MKKAVDAPNDATSAKTVLEHNIHNWIANNVLKPRGHNFFYSAILALLFPELRLIKGKHSKQLKEDIAHFFVIDPDGKKYDPTHAQYEEDELEMGPEINPLKNIDAIIQDKLFKTLSSKDQGKILKLVELTPEKSEDEVKLEEESEEGVEPKKSSIVSIVQRHLSNSETDYVNFGDVSRSRLGQQSQYAVRYTGVATKGDNQRDPEGWAELGYPDLGEGLRFKGNSNAYHSLKIHKDDIEEFVKRYKDYQDQQAKRSNSIELDHPEEPQIITFPEEEWDSVKEQLESGQELTTTRNSCGDNLNLFSVGEKYLTEWGDEVVITEIEHFDEPTEIPTWDQMDEVMHNSINQSIGLCGTENLQWVHLKKMDEEKEASMGKLSSNQIVQKYLRKTKKLSYGSYVEYIETGKPFRIWVTLPLMVDGKEEEVYIDYSILLDEKDWEAPYSPDFVTGGWDTSKIKFHSIDQALPNDETDKRDFTAQVIEMTKNPLFVKKLLGKASSYLVLNFGRVLPKHRTEWHPTGKDYYDKSGLWAEMDGDREITSSEITSSETKINTNQVIQRHLAKNTLYKFAEKLKLKKVPIGEKWYDVLKGDEKDIIRKYIETPREAYWNKEDYDFGNWALSMFHEIHELLPFDDSRIAINDWLNEARKQGIITGQEESRLIRFCLESLSF